jgi:gamma-glutamyltranspeptidase
MTLSHPDPGRNPLPRRLRGASHLSVVDKQKHRCPHADRQLFLWLSVLVPGTGIANDEMDDFNPSPALQFGEPKKRPLSGMTPPSC